MTPSPAPRPTPVWYVQAGGRVWGPYPQGRLAEFIGEGRLTPQSLIGPQPSGPFGPAGRRRELAALFPPATPTQPAPAPASDAGEPGVQAASIDRAAVTPRVPERAMVVWADLASLTPAKFEAVLAAYGPYAAIRPGLWLIQARMTPSALRNALSRRLKTDDALLVMQAPLDQTAWFNLAPTAERELRQLWGGQG